MAHVYKVQPAERVSLIAAFKNVKRKAKAAISTNAHLELTVGRSEAQEMEGTCESLIAVVESMVGVKLELTPMQTKVARSALRIYLLSLEKKEAECVELLNEVEDYQIAELRGVAERIGKLVRVFNQQGDAFEEPPVAVVDASATVEEVEAAPVTDDAAGADAAYADDDALDPKDAEIISMSSTLALVRTTPDDAVQPIEPETRASRLLSSPTKAKKEKKPKAEKVVKEKKPKPAPAPKSVVRAVPKPSGKTGWGASAPSVKRPPKKRGG